MLLLIFLGEVQRIQGIISREAIGEDTLGLGYTAMWMGMGYIGTVGMALYTAGHVLKVFKGQVGWICHLPHGNLVCSRISKMNYLGWWIFLGTVSWVSPGKTCTEFGWSAMNTSNGKAGSGGLNGLFLLAISIFFLFLSLWEHLHHRQQQFIRSLFQCIPCWSDW